jgi:hypothetical protein
MSTPVVHILRAESVPFPAATARSVVGMPLFELDICKISLYVWLGVCPKNEVPILFYTP